MVIAQKERVLVYVLGRKQDLKGERGKTIYQCMPTVLPLILP